MFIVNGVSGALLHCINFRVATDPACGSGNFLTETYLELRRLENRALSIINKGQIIFGDILNNPIKVSLDQFYGIEINDFAVAVANTALFISEYQMLKETESILNRHIDYLPLHSFNGIHEGNALRMDWNEILPADQCNYVMGNPPFVGHQWRTKEQTDDMKIAFWDLKKHGKLDYVCAWYNKAADYMKNTSIEAAFVSTNSIVQGESVVILWTFLMEKGIKINFAYQTFIWTNETKNSASVYCVIIGFSIRKERKNKRIYTENSSKIAENINGYLLDGPNIFLKARKQPISSNVPFMHRGSDPVDGGYLLMSLEDKENYIKEEPEGIPYIHPYMMGREFLNKIERFCFWLEDVPPHLLKRLPILLKRIEKVRDYRLKSSSKSTVRAADTPSLFYRRVQPKNAFLAIPKVSSEKRRYIPIGFLNSDIIAGDMLFIAENPTLYHFGILTSNIHNAWMRTVAGRLKSDYRYSKDIVYNNFPWPEPTEDQKKKIEKTAQGILDARANYPDSSLADLYDELTMPEDLRKAHRANDRVVMEAYGWNWRKMTEEDCVAELMKLYKQLDK